MSILLMSYISSFAAELEKPKVGMSGKGLTWFKKHHFSYVAEASTPIHDFLDFFPPVLCTILSLSR